MSYVDISNVWRPLTTHTLAATTSSGSTATSAFDTGVAVVMVTATAACFVAMEPKVRLLLALEPQRYTLLN